MTAESPQFEIFRFPEASVNDFAFWHQIQDSQLTRTWFASAGVGTWQIS